METWKGLPSASVSEKLATTRSAISAWNRSQQRNSMMIIEQKKLELNAALSSAIEDSGLIQEISNQLNSAYLAEEEYWKQRSLVLWLKLGDRNTGYFHAITKSRKRKNSFSALERIDEQMVHKEEEIVQVIGDYFDQLFTSSPGERAATVNQALHSIITPEDNSILTSVPSAAEIKDAAFSIQADKAPVPDGFSAGFFHTHWDEI